MYLLLPGIKINEDGLRLIASNNDAKCISKLVKEGNRYLMLYLVHDATYGGGDDVLANPCTHAPDVISHMKSKINESVADEQSIVLAGESSASMLFACEGNAEGTSRSRRGITEVEEEYCSETRSEDSDTQR